MHSATRSVVLLIALAVLLICATGARADNVTFNFTFTGPNISGSGTAAATGSGGVYTITSLSGSENIFGTGITALDGAHSITGIVPAVSSDVYLLPGGAYEWLYDDVITPAANPSVDFYGPLFTVSGLTSFPSNTVNICSYCGNGEEYSELIYVGTGGNLNGFGGAFEDLAITGGTLVDPVTPPVPEPSSLLLLGVGLVALMSVRRGKPVADSGNLT